MRIAKLTNPNVEIARPPPSHTHTHTQIEENSTNQRKGYVSNSRKAHTKNPSGSKNAIFPVTHDERKKESIQIAKNKI